MRICLLVEGSYPYVVGGVASWIQMLITGMPEHEFIIYSIGAEEKNRGKFKYKLPENVVEIHELFLDSILRLSHRGDDSFKLTDWEKEVLMELLDGQGHIRLADLLMLFRDPKRRNFLDIFMSFDFFDVITTVYKRKFSYLPFTDYFWTVRSMLLPMFYLLQYKVPQADIFHSVAAGYGGIVGAVAAAVTGKPYYLTEHGIYAREREEEILKCDWAKGDFKAVWIDYFYHLSEMNYQQATRVFTLFEQNADIESELGCDRAKIDIVPNGIRHERFMKIPPLPEEREGLIIGAVVRVVPIKDIRTMLRAFYFVKQRVPQAKFLIMGPCDEDEDYYKECLELRDTLGVADVEFTGTIQVLEYLERLDILVLTSLSEGQPLAILEGMAAARPYVATDVGCCRELLYGTEGDSDGQAGLIAPVLDFRQLAEHIIHLAENPTKRRQFGLNGRARVCRSYTYEEFIRRYRQIYQAAQSAEESEPKWQA